MTNYYKSVSKEEAELMINEEIAKENEEINNRENGEIGNN